MEFREKPLGKNVRFLLPSLKLMQPSGNGGTLAQQVHEFLVENFGGYTATAANLFGFWKDESGEQSYGEHREYVVALPDDGSLPQLKDFLGRLARQMDEECVYVDVAGLATLVYGTPREQQV